MDYEYKNYYKFDDKDDEVVFPRHNMPSPWITTLQTVHFFTMISQAGGSLSRYNSPEIWRIGRYNLYNLPTRQRTVYLGSMSNLNRGKNENKKISKNKMFSEILAPPVGFEPTTLRLTAGCSRIRSGL